MRSLFLFLLIPPLAGEEFPVRMASEARVQLIVPDAHPPLESVRVSEGTVSDGGWLEDKAARERLKDIHFPVSWWRPREITVSFTPRHDGPVELHLGGPWAQDESGTLLRQEILWDSVAGDGMAVVNGDFDDAGGGAPKGWNSPWRSYPARGEWPTEPGAGASWHGRPLTRMLDVVAGEPVTLTLTARAATPPDFDEPDRLGDDTPAHAFAAGLKRGVNLGNGWEAPPEGWGIEFAPADIDRIAGQGFDHIRVPVAWHYWLEDEGISPELLGELEPVLRRALERDLRVILNWHHFDDLTGDPAAHRDRFVDGWRHIAGHFAGWPDALCLELLNEPHSALSGDRLNEVHAEAIAAIRERHPERTLMVNPGAWASPDALGTLRLPDGDANLVVSIHCYEPFEFTHQGAGWVDLEALDGVMFPGPPEEPLDVPPSLKDRVGSWIARYNTLEGDANPSSARAFHESLDTARAWSDHFGRPVHVGEFGAYQTADAASRRRYARAMRRACEARDLPWCWWEWKAGFGYWDRDAGEPLLRPALFGD